MRSAQIVERDMEAHGRQVAIDLLAEAVTDQKQTASFFEGSFKLIYKDTKNEAREAKDLIG